MALSPELLDSSPTDELKALRAACHQRDGTPLPQAQACAGLLHWQSGTPRAGTMPKLGSLHPRASKWNKDQAMTTPLRLTMTSLTCTIF